jgi:hypothetical protein
MREKPSAAGIFQSREKKPVVCAASSFGVPLLDEAKRRLR